MANRMNLDRAIQDLGEYLPDEIIARYQRTRFKTPSRLEQSVSPFIVDGGVGFSVNFYAEFLDQGTRFITADPFLQPVLDDEGGEIADMITIAFETDIDETIQEAAAQGGASIA